MSTIKSPANAVIEAFGGVRQTARALGVSPSTVSRWNSRDRNKKHKGTIPSSMHLAIISASKRKRLNITPYHLIYGVSEAETVAE